MTLLHWILAGAVIAIWFALCLAFFVARGVFGFVSRFWKRF
jgi:hypothetical protein